MPTRLYALWPVPGGVNLHAVCPQMIVQEEKEFVFSLVQK
jgi:hypothetical protein